MTTRDGRFNQTGTGPTMADVQPGKFHPQATLKGYALNRMCFTLNAAENRAAFTADPDSYCARFGLNEEELAAVRSRDKTRLFAAGGNMYFLAKLDRVPKPEGAR
jgi:protocatechuate 4,5-dioxygenase alpha chain